MVFFRPLLIFLIFCLFWPWLKPCARKREQRKKFSLKMMTCFVLNWTCSNLGEKVKRTKLEWTWCNSLDLLPIVFGMGGWGGGEKSGLLNVGWLVVVDLPLLHRPVPYQLQLAHQATRATRASTRAPPLVFHQATLPPWPAVQHPLHQRWKCLLVLPADSLYIFYYSQRTIFFIEPGPRQSLKFVSLLSTYRAIPWSFKQVSWRYNRPSSSLCC